jgi:hypothetical protein
MLELGRSDARKYINIFLDTFRENPSVGSDVLNTGTQKTQKTYYGLRMPVYYCKM